LLVFIFTVLVIFTFTDGFATPAEPTTTAEVAEAAAASKARVDALREECGCSWRYGEEGEACSAVCSSAGMGCEDGDWGVHGEQSMRVALEAAGQNPNAVCTGFYSNSGLGYPYVYESVGNCFYYPEGSSSGTYWGTGAHPGVRQLCKCVHPPPPPACDTFDRPGSDHGVTNGHLCEATVGCTWSHGMYDCHESSVQSAQEVLRTNPQVVTDLQDAFSGNEAATLQEIFQECPSTCCGGRDLWNSHRSGRECTMPALVAKGCCDITVCAAYHDYMVDNAFPSSSKCSASAPHPAGR
jgi:hypothetical protein